MASSHFKQGLIRALIVALSIFKSQELTDWHSDYVAKVRVKLSLGLLGFTQS